MANTRTQRTKEKTLKKKYRQTHETTVATNTTGGQQKKALRGRTLQTNPPAGPAQSTVAKDAKRE